MVDLIGNVALVTAELVTNAVEHGCSDRSGPGRSVDVDIAVARQCPGADYGAIRISVRDDNPYLPPRPPQPPDPNAPPETERLEVGGFGLLLVRMHVACLDAVPLPDGGKLMRALLKIYPEDLTGDLATSEASGADRGPSDEETPHR